jgi:ubiquitin carboxyl-terminal hydrolase 34
MSAPDPPSHLSLPMPESSRTRSDSLEESGSQQDRKRPRLSSSNADQLSSEEALTDSGCPASAIVPPKTPAPQSTDNQIVASEQHHLNKMPTSPGGLPSKVTINTRHSQANQPTHQPSTPPQSPHISKTSEQSSSVDNKSCDTDSAPEIVAAPPDTVSISSSPSKSPEIQVAEPEDIDQNPAETRWTPITRFSSNFNRQEFPAPHYVYRTFPYAGANSTFGAVHAMLPQLCTIFENGRDKFPFDGARLS